MSFTNARARRDGPSTECGTHTKQDTAVKRRGHEVPRREKEGGRENKVEREETRSIEGPGGTALSRERESEGGHRPRKVLQTAPLEKEKLR